MQTSLIIGVLASIFTALSLLPQLIKMIKQKSAGNISIGTLVVLLLGLILWSVYGALIKDYIIVASNTFSLIIDIVILILSFKYKKLASHA